MSAAQASLVPGGVAHAHAGVRSLCRRYELASFGVARVRWCDAAGLRAHPVHWAFGWLADDECEPLGVWMELGAESAAAPHFVADLRRRGLEQVRRVAAAGPAPLRERVAAAFPQAEPASDADVAAAEAVRTALRRALGRRGGFANAGAALDFVCCALQRTERRLDRERAIAKVRPRHDSGAQTVPSWF